MRKSGEIHLSARKILFVRYFEFIYLFSIYYECRWGWGKFSLFSGKFSYT